MSEKRRIPHITIYTGGQTIPSLPFHGELMTCCICGTQHRSDPKEDSNWTCFQLGAERVYLCPGCWSKDNLNQENLRKALRYLARRKQNERRYG